MSSHCICERHDLAHVATDQLDLLPLDDAFSPDRFNDFEESTRDHIVKLLIENHIRLEETFTALYNVVIGSSPNTYHEVFATASDPIRMLWIQTFYKRRDEFEETVILPCLTARVRELQELEGDGTGSATTHGKTAPFPDPDPDMDAYIHFVRVLLTVAEEITCLLPLGVPGSRAAKYLLFVGRQITKTGGAKALPRDTHNPAAATEPIVAADRAEGGNELYEEDGRTMPYCEAKERLAKTVAACRWALCELDKVEAEAKRYLRKTLETYTALAFE